MAPSYVLGIDGGTESLRVGVFDASGQPLSFAACPYSTQYPQPGWAEQRPEDWWHALGVATRAAVKDAGIQPQDIAAMCLDTTCCTVVALDASGRALLPAMLWMDMRSAQCAQEVCDTGDAALKVNGGGRGPVSAEWMVPKALWLQQHEPQVFDSAAHICEYQDYLNFHLTGRMVASVNNASVRWHYSTQTGWPVSLLEKLGLQALLAKWPQTLLPPGAVVGPLTADAAGHLGLPAGLPVAQGGADAFIGMLGLGVVRAGQLALLTGSSHLQLGVADRPIHGPGIFGTYADAVLPGLHVVEGGQTSTGSVVAWLKRLLGPEASYEQLNREAAEVPAGCEGLLCLDHFQGNRTPHTDPLSRGAITGLTLKHSRAHLFRGLIEAVAFGTAHIVETLEANGFACREIAIAGGATRSDLWLQIHSDTANVPLQLTKVSDAPALGCAILAAVAAGWYPDIPAAVEAMVTVTRTIPPDAAAHAAYAPVYERYKALYPALTVVRPRPPAAAAPDTSHKAAANRSQSDGSVSAAAPPAAPLRPHFAPSILAADFANLAAELRVVEVAGGADWLHVDIFDGSYVPNFTFGPPVLAALRRHTSLLLDCHLCVSEPRKYIEQVAEAGGNVATFHIEVMADQAEAAALAADIRALGMRPGIALSPETPAEAVSGLVASGAVDLVLVMSVKPGFGGQAFMPHTMDKVRRLRCLFPGLDLQVDGGINADTARTAVEAGANVLVAGSAVFGAAEGVAAAIAALTAPLNERYSNARK